MKMVGPTGLKGVVLSGVCQGGDQESFVERAMDILLNLTEGAAVRYGLSEEDVDAWRASLSADVVLGLGQTVRIVNP